MISISRRNRMSLAILVLASLGYHRWSTNNHQTSRRSTEIGAVVLEFENFAHDVLDTANALSPLVSSITIVSDHSIYPPLDNDSLQNVSQNVERFHVLERHGSVQTSHRDWSLEANLDTNFLLIVPDGTRVFSTTTADEHLKKKTAQMLEENIEAVLFPLFDSYCHGSCSIMASVKCREFHFDIKRWTLDYSVADEDNDMAKNSCEYLNENGFVVLIQRKAFFKLHNPTLKPFMHSFFVQSHIANLRVQLNHRKLFLLEASPVREPRLREKKTALNEQRKRQLYTELGVKLVKNIDGSKQWYGCDRSSPRCFGSIVRDIPDYMVRGRWLPPCCRENLEHTGRYVLELLNKAGIRHWLEGGSLLGAARNGQIIPWDYDIDIGIYLEDCHKLTFLERLLDSPPGSQIEDGQGFVWQKAIEADFIKVHFSAHNRIHVDLFPFYSSNGTMTKDTWLEDHPQDMPFPERFLEPLTSIPFIGMEAPSPNNVREFLELKFGKGCIEEARYPRDFVMDFD